MAAGVSCQIFLRLGGSDCLLGCLQCLVELIVGRQAIGFVEHLLHRERRLGLCRFGGCAAVSPTGYEPEKNQTQKTENIRAPYGSSLLHPMPMPLHRIMIYSCLPVTFREEGELLSSGSEAKRKLNKIVFLVAVYAIDFQSVQSRL